MELFDRCHRISRWTIGTLFLDDSTVKYTFAAFGGGTEITKWKYEI